MNRIVLQALNAPFFVLLVTIAVAIQTSLFSTPQLTYLQPDVVLFAVVWMAMKRNFTEGGLLTLIICNIAEVHSGAPMGIYMVSFMLIYLMIRMMAKYLLFSRLTSLIGLTLVSTLVWNLLQLFLLNGLGVLKISWQVAGAHLLSSMVINGLLGVWVYRWLERFDIHTFKDIRASGSGNMQNPGNEDELDFEWSYGDEGL